MKIAVTYENGQIFQHFGHTEQFKIYEVVDGIIISSTVLSTMGSGHGALTVILKEQEIDKVICGGIGAGAKTALADAGIKLYGGVQGEADQAVEDLLQNNLKFNPDIECSHHHSEEHSSGEHECGKH